MTLLLIDKFFKEPSTDSDSDIRRDIYYGRSLKYIYKYDGGNVENKLLNGRREPLCEKMENRKNK